ncbi:hypothetical protein [Paenibacillus sp. RUD330]|nr:hypothetical protein [Paenibacillus sp. RUD330]QID16089.1 hypothetical protein CIC07_25535 [Paenibacillus sp. RUD330]
MKTIINGKDPAELAAEERRRSEVIEDFWAIIISPGRAVVWLLRSVRK